MRNEIEVLGSVFYEKKEGRNMISVVYSTEHLLMPKIIGTLLVIMLAVIVLVEGRERKAATGKIFGSFGPFFRENADFKKLFGTLLLFIGYIFVVEEVGFTVTSIIFVFLFNVLYTGWSKKALRTSLIIFHPGTCHCQSNFWCCFQYYASQRNLQYHLH